MATNAAATAIGGFTTRRPIAITPDGKTAYVVGDGAVTPVDVSARTKGTDIPVAGAQAVAITPDGKTAYVATATGVTPIDVASNTAGAEIAGLADARALAVTPDGKTLWSSAPAS